MKPIAIAIILVSLLASSAQASTYEIVSSEYGKIGELIGIGDRLYKITYDNGVIEYQVARDSFKKLKPGFITYIQKDYTLKEGDKYALVTVTLRGISSILDGQNWHKHVIVVEKYGTRDVVSTEEFQVPSNTDKEITLMVGPITATQRFVAREYIYMSTGAKASGDVVDFTVTVPGAVATSSPTATPTPTATQTTTVPPPTTETKGDILVWSSPADADVYLDGAYKGKTVVGDWFKVSMPVGTYEVRVVKSSYDTFTQKVTVSTKEYAKVQATLTALGGATSTGTPPPPPSDTGSSDSDTGSEEEDEDTGMDSRILFAAVGVVLLIVIYFVTGSKKK